MRFPGWVYRRGQEPDPRFTLANERTFLAWVRTSLALIAGGVALETFAEGHLITVVSYLLLVCAVVLPLVAWVQWARSEKAMRMGAPLPANPAMVVLAAVVVVAAVLLGVGHL